MIHFKLFFVIFLFFEYSCALPVLLEESGPSTTAGFVFSDNGESLLNIPSLTASPVIDSPTAFANESEHEAVTQTVPPQSSSDSEVHQMITILPLDTSSDLSLVDSVSTSHSSQIEPENGEKAATPTIDSIGLTEPNFILTTEQQEQLSTVEPVLTGESLANSDTDGQLTQTPTEPTTVLDSENDHRETSVTKTEQLSATTTPFSTECKTNVEPFEVNDITQSEVKEEAVANTENLISGELPLSQRSTDGQNAQEGEQHNSGHSELIISDTQPNKATVNLPVTSSIETSHESLVATDSTVHETTDGMASPGEAKSTELTDAELITTPLSVEVSSTPSTIADPVASTSKSSSSADRDGLQTLTESAPSMLSPSVGSNTTHRLLSASISRSQSSASEKNASFLLALFVILAHCFVINF